MENVPRRSVSVALSSNVSKSKRTRSLYVTENSEAAWKKRWTFPHADQFLIARRRSGAAKLTDPEAKCASAAAGRLLHPLTPTAPCLSELCLAPELVGDRFTSVFLGHGVGRGGRYNRGGGQNDSNVCIPLSCHLKNGVDSWGQDQFLSAASKQNPRSF